MIFTIFCTSINNFYRTHYFEFFILYALALLPPDYNLIASVCSDENGHS
jgi:hypothetical protein